jgi:hypothetical protein
MEMSLHSQSDVAKDTMPKEKRNTKKKLAKLKTRKGDLGNRERPGGSKT